MPRKLHPFGRPDLTHEGPPLVPADPLLLEDQIRLRAYAIWEARGGGDGDDLADWFEAELERAPQVDGGF